LAISKGRLKRTRGSTGKSLPAERKDDGRQLDRLRRLCLSMPGAVEKLSHGAPTFFTPARVFAMFVDNHHGDGHVAAWLPAGPGVQETLIEEAPQIYFRPPYVGPAGWIGVEMSRIDDEWLASLVREAHQLIAAKERKAGARRPSRRRPTAKNL
jgi:hypothetical protein